MDYPIKYIWDDDAKVWIATSDIIEGLVLESESLEALIKEVASTVPELIDLNKEIKLPSIEEFEAALDKAASWAEASGYIESDVNDIIKSVRKRDQNEGRR